MRDAHIARWGEDNDWMLRSQPMPKDWDEYNAGNSALVAAHKEVFRAALALGDVEQVETGDDGRTGYWGGPAQR